MENIEFMINTHVFLWGKFMGWFNDPIAFRIISLLVTAIIFPIIIMIIRLTGRKSILEKMEHDSSIDRVNFSIYGTITMIIITFSISYFTELFGIINYLIFSIYLTSALLTSVIFPRSNAMYVIHQYVGIIFLFNTALFVGDAVFTATPKNEPIPLLIFWLLFSYLIYFLSTETHKKLNRIIPRKKNNKKILITLINGKLVFGNLKGITRKGDYIIKISKNDGVSSIDIPYVILSWPLELTINRSQILSIAVSESKEM
ncbi:hypothetical protein [Cohnella sp.]|uniref:hypothetical protein n=1 Tax=Cohnella sp. TaxID=1883426 RepID=UPI00356728A2